MFKFFKRQSAEALAAPKLYSALLAQARNPAFYGSDKVFDNYDGRIDMLSLHLALVMFRLRSFDEAGQALTQALYDVMVDDFNIALREEGLADEGIKRRIKPMVQLFYARLKVLSETLETGMSSEQVIGESLLKVPEQVGFVPVLAAYTDALHAELSGMTYAQIAAAEIKFPAIIA